MKNVVVFVLIFCLSNTWAQVSDFETVDFTRADNTAKLYKGYALDNLGFKRLQIIVHKSNIPSLTVAEKSAYLWQRTLPKEYTPPNEEPLDMELYELIKELK